MPRLPGMWGELRCVPVGGHWLLRSPTYRTATLAEISALYAHFWHSSEFALSYSIIQYAGVDLALLNLTCYLKGGLVLNNPLLSSKGLRAPFHNLFAVKIQCKTTKSRMLRCNLYEQLSLTCHMVCCNISKIGQHCFGSRTTWAHDLWSTGTQNK